MLTGLEEDGSVTEGFSIHPERLGAARSAAGKIGNTMLIVWVPG